MSIIKPYSKKELKELYGISSNTLLTWAKKSFTKKEFEEYKKIKLIPIKMVQHLFTHLGEPEIK